MGNCLCKRKREPKRSLTLGIFGLDNAGKTTTVKVLAGDPHTETTPTVGFNHEDVGVHNYDIKFYDLGGGKKIRDIWQTYFPEVYGIVYVVDSTASGRMDEIKHNLKILVEDEKIKGKPLLLLANKQDQDNALDEVDILEQLNLENIVNTNKCPCRIETCSAIKGTGKRMDPNIKSGVKWLCGIIDHNWEKYHTRVEKDKEVDSKRREAELEARRERVRKLREEREKKEQEENERLGIKSVEDEDEDIEEMKGGPFRRVDVRELEKKERKVKEEKRRKRDKEKQYGENNEDESDTEIPRSDRSRNRFGGLYSNSPLYANSINNNRSNDDDDDDGFLPPIQKRDTPRLPPLQRPLGTKFNEESPVKKLRKKKKKPKLKALKENVEENHVEEGVQNYSRTYTSDYMDDQREGDINTSYKESVNSLSKIELNAMSSLRRAQNGFPNDGFSRDSVEEDVELTTRKKKKGSKKKSKAEDLVNGYGHDLSTPRTLAKEEDGTDDDVTPRREKLKRANAVEEDDAEIRTNRKKKSYLRNNKTYPSDDDSLSGETADRDFSWTMNPMGKHFSPRGAKITTSHTNWDKKRNTPRDIDLSISSTRNWGLAEELPEIDNSSTFSRRIRSNVEDDEDIVY